MAVGCNTPGRGRRRASAMKSRFAETSRLTCATYSAAVSCSSCQPKEQRFAVPNSTTRDWHILKCSASLATKTMSPSSFTTCPTKFRMAVMTRSETFGIDDKTTLLRRPNFLRQRVKGRRSPRKLSNTNSTTSHLSKVPGTLYCRTAETSTTSASPQNKSANSTQHPCHNSCAIMSGHNEDMIFFCKAYTEQLSTVFQGKTTYNIRVDTTSEWENDNH